MKLRPFDPASDADYATLAALLNATTPDYPTTPGDIREWDGKREERARFGRWFAEEGGRPVGVCSHDQMPWQYHPRRFFIDVRVEPEWQGRGIGAAMYRHILDAIEPHEPLSVKTMVREDWERSMRFVTDRGFVEILRAHESRLDLPAFDLGPFREALDAPAAHGVVLKTLAELWSESDVPRRLHALDVELLKDLPTAEPITPLTLEQFEKLVLGSSHLLKDAYAVAVDEATGAWVGVNALWKRSADNDLDNGLTGVVRSHRRRGIALALKLKNIAWAKANGFQYIRTDNEVNNVGMLAINERLGFRRVPPWIEFSKTLREEPAEGTSE
ncbi:MAG TPA: GNAT family N-acetyltransferase [Armatimonadaceae bacterium]|nr:GNAT family N-acetyltransferase [Armatimonadaceae bacterium]